MNLFLHGDQCQTTTLTLLGNDFPGDEIGLAAQQKSYTSLSSCNLAQGGITTSDPTYQIFNSARALSTKVLPLKDSALCLQELRQFRTASIRGSQFASSMRAFPMKIPSTLILEDVQLMATGASAQSHQERSHRPSHLLRFNLDPEPFSNLPYHFMIARSEVTTTDVSSAYRDRTGRGLGIRGNSKPLM